MSDQNAGLRLSLEQVLGYLGSAILFVGLFLPLFEISGEGPVNFFWNGHADGLAVLLLIAGSMAALLLGRSWGLWLTGISALVVIGFTFIRVLLRAEVRAAELSWGWPILAIGAALLVASAEVGRRAGAALPRALWDVVVATSLILTAIILGPGVLSGTQKAMRDFQVTKRIEERERWVPHESARAEMASVIAHVRREGEHSDEEAAAARAAEEERRLRAEERRIAQVRLVAEIRRWYPGFAETLRPVLDARQAFLDDYEAGGLEAARPACGSIADVARVARDRFPRGPDRALDTVTLGLIDLYATSAEACSGAAGADHALIDLERTEERIGTQLGVLAESLAAYCLAVPAAGAGGADDPGAVMACDPRDRA